MDIGPFLNTTPATPILAAAITPRRPAQDTTKTQPGEDPSELANGVVRGESAQPDQNAVRTDDRETRAEERQLRELEERDREVRSHEQAHRQAGGELVRGGSYQYQRGPDGRMYAVGGEVSIDTSRVADDPAATLRRAQTIQRAALAPAEPSPQDRTVAAEAAAMIAQARAEMQAQRFRDEEAGADDATGFSSYA